MAMMRDGQFKSRECINLRLADLQYIAQEDTLVELPGRWKTDTWGVHKSKWSDSQWPNSEWLSIQALRLAWSSPILAWVWKGQLTGCMTVDGGTCITATILDWNLQFALRSDMKGSYGQFLSRSESVCGRTLVRGGVSGFGGHLSKHVSGIRWKLDCLWLGKIYVPVNVTPCAWNRLLRRQIFTPTGRTMKKWSVYFTPCLLHRLHGIPSALCSRCGTADGTFFHLMWECPPIRKYWSEVTAFISSIT